MERKEKMDAKKKKKKRNWVYKKRREEKEDKKWRQTRKRGGNGRIGERRAERKREEEVDTHTHRERERERERGSQQKNHFLCSRWNSGKSRGSQPMLVNSVGRITTALFWMMTLYNDHDAILFYLLSNTYCCCLYFYCPTVEA